MKKVAIYFIPNGDFYKTGSETIGFDIRNKKKLQKKPSNKYGFHLTLTDVFLINDSQISSLIKKVERIVNLPFWKISLTPKSIGEMPNADVLAILFYWDFKLFLLHTLLVIFIQSFGKNSEFSLQNNKLSFWRKLKIKIFNSPYILDDFMPHITIAKGTTINKNIKNKFQKYLGKDIKLNEIYLVEEDKNKKSFTIVHSFAIKN